MAPFRCLRLLSAEARRDEEGMTFVDIGNGQQVATPVRRNLRMPLHEIKTKTFLRGGRVGLVSDGKRFAAMEKECENITASGVRDVAAVLAVDAELQTQLETIAPHEFIVERRYGRWHIVNKTSEQPLAEPYLNADAPASVGDTSRRGSASAGLERTLIVYDDAIGIDNALVVRNDSVHGQAFVLEGGIAGFRRYRMEASAMAIARAGPRINERGCGG